MDNGKECRKRYLQVDSRGQSESEHFVFEVAKGSPDVSVYSTPKISVKTKLLVSFTAGEIVVCDVIRQSPWKRAISSPLRHLGWMYERMSDLADRRMINLP